MPQKTLVVICALLMALLGDAPQASAESNFLTHTYKVEIKNTQAALRISINKELYSNGQRVNAYSK